MPRPKKGQPGDIEATKKWHQTMQERYGAIGGAHGFMQSIGSKGGRNGTTGGYYANRELARTAGAIGGSISRRGLKFIRQENGKLYYIDKQGREVVHVQKEN